MVSKRLCFYTKRLNPNRPDYCRGRGNTKQPISDRLDINYNYRLFLRSLVILSYCRRTWPFSVTVHSRDIFIWLMIATNRRLPIKQMFRLKPLSSSIAIQGKILLNDFAIKLLHLTLCNPTRVRCRSLEVYLNISFKDATASGKPILLKSKI